jgi:hypothetical protein
MCAILTKAQALIQELMILMPTQYQTLASTDGIITYACRDSTSTTFSQTLRARYQCDLVQDIRKRSDRALA